MRRGLLALTLAVLTASPAWADRWTSDYQRSGMQFQGDSNSGPVRGDFGKHKVSMRIEAEELEDAYLKANIQTSSMRTLQPANDLAFTSATLLYTQMFPYVIFESNDIVRLNDGRYEARGTVNLGSATGNARLRFTLEEAPGKKNTARLNGIAKLDSLKFGEDNQPLIGDSMVGSTVRLAVDLYSQAAAR